MPANSRWDLIRRLRVKERRGYSHLKEEALDRTMWRAGFGRGFGPVARQTTKWMNEYQPIVRCRIWMTINLLWGAEYEWLSTYCEVQNMNDYQPIVRCRIWIPDFTPCRLTVIGWPENNSSRCINKNNTTREQGTRIYWHPVIAVVRYFLTHPVVAVPFFF